MTNVAVEFVSTNGGERERRESEQGVVQRGDWMRKKASKEGGGSRGSRE